MKKKVIRVHATGLKARDFDMDTHDYSIGNGSLLMKETAQGGYNVARYPKYLLVEIVEVSSD